MSFANQEVLAAHLRAERRCENETPSTEEEIMYITQEQERELRRKRKNIREEDRWFNYFRIIFPTVPDDQLPSSPCKPKTSQPATYAAAMRMSTPY